MPALGGDPRLLIAGATSPKPSPDHKRIAYKSNGQLFVDSLPLSQPIAISPIDQRQTVAWSPDGKRLMYGNEEIYSVAADGKDRQQTGLFENLRKRRMQSEFWTRVIRWLPNEDIFFSTPYGDAWNVWRIPLRDLDSGTPTPITSGNSQFIEADVVPGKVVYTVNTGTASIWSLPCDLNAGQVLGPLRQLLDYRADVLHPDITPDGSQMVYCSRGNGPQSIWIKDLRTGKNQLLAQSNLGGDDYSHVMFGPDGKQVAALFNDIQKTTFPTGQGIVVINAAGGAPKRIADGGKRIRGWTPDGRYLLLWSIAGKGQISLLEVATGKNSVIVQNADRSFGAPRLSKDGRWLAFTESAGPLYVAPVHGTQAIEEREWMKIADRAISPAWSPDGNTIYYVNGGFGSPTREFMRQPLDPGTKGPVGQSSGLFVFDGQRFTDQIINPIAVARDQIVVVLQEQVSDIWSMDLRE